MTWFASHFSPVPCLWGSPRFHPHWIHALSSILRWATHRRFIHQSPASFVSGRCRRRRLVRRKIVNRFKAIEYSVAKISHQTSSTELALDIHQQQFKFMLSHNAKHPRINKEHSLPECMLTDVIVRNIIATTSNKSEIAREHALAAPAASVVCSQATPKAPGRDKKTSTPMKKLLCFATVQSAVLFWNKFGLILTI